MAPRRRLPFRSELAPIPLALRLRARRRGFKGWSAFVYDLARHDPSHFLPDSANKRLKRVNGAATRAMMRNKLLSSTTLARHVPMPRLRALVDSGRVEAFEGPDVGGPDGLARLAEEAGGLILKPMADSTGRGVHLLERDASGVRIDGRTVDREAYLRFLGGLDGTLVVDRVRPAAYSSAIFAGSVNTIRVVTIRDVDTGRGHVVLASHRFGTSASAPTDNVGRGGVAAGIRLGDGGMEKAANWKPGPDGRERFESHHPETGARIEGVRVPAFDRVLEMVRGAHDGLPSLHYCGWDVALDERNEPVVIEANDFPTLYFQRHNPYLADPHMRRFLEHHGVVEAAPGEVGRPLPRAHP